MKTWKLVSGIICCVLTVLVLFQSCAASLGETLENSSSSDGAAGFLVAIFMLAGGIISIVTRKSNSKGGNIAMMVLFLIAALLGFANSRYYQDLMVWAIWCLICGVLAFISLIKRKKQN